MRPSTCGRSIERARVSGSLDAGAWMAASPTASIRAASARDIRNAGRTPPRPKEGMCLAAFRWLYCNLCAFANLVCAATDNHLAILQRAEDLDEIADARTAANIHPLGHAVIHANDKGALGR